MKKFSVVLLSLFVAVILGACSANEGTKESGKDEPKVQEESAQATTVKTEVKVMQDNLAKVVEAIDAKDAKVLKETAAVMHKHWLAYENNVRDLYPLLYTDVEKYETPIFYASTDEAPDFTSVSTNAQGLEKALVAVANAKETQEKTSEVLDQAVEKYKEYVIEQVDLFVQDTKVFTDAVKANDMEKSKEYYAKARVYYERIEPVAESFGDLDPKIDARINDVESEAEWTGYHVIERALWENGSLANMAPVADQLMTDVKALQSEIKNVELTAKPMVAGAMELLNEAATTKITGEEEAYSHIDLVDLNANVEGSKTVYQAIIPALNVSDKALVQQIDDAFNQLETTLMKYKKNNQFLLYTDLTKEQIREISEQLSNLSEFMAQTGKIF